MSPWFRSLWAEGILRSFFDFINEQGLFPDVRPHQHFCLMTCSSSTEKPRPVFAFGLRDPRELNDEGVKMQLAVELLDALSPEIGVLPLVNSPEDFPVLRGLHERHESLADWGIQYRQGLFNTASDSDLFETEPVSGKAYYPLFDSKMARQYNHRAASLSFSGASSRRISSKRAELEELQDPTFRPKPAYWVERGLVEKELQDWDRDWILGFKDVTGSTSLRLAVAAFIPRVAVGHPFPLITLGGGDAVQHAVVCATINSLAIEYVLRIKMTGLHLTKGLLRELPIPCATTLNTPVEWLEGRSPASWIAQRVLELSYTSEDLAGLAGDLDYYGRPFRWDPERRSVIRSEIDGLLLHLFSLDRSRAEFVLDSLPRIRKREVRKIGSYRTKLRVLETWDAIQEAVESNRPLQTPLDPPPGDPRAAHRA